MVDSPWPAAAYRYAARQRIDWVRHSTLRVSARPIVIGLPDRLASTVAPASASPLDGGTGTNMSSQISTPMVRPATSVAANSRSVPNGARRPATSISSPAIPSPGRELAPLVELPIVRQVDLRHHAEDPAAVDHDGGVEQPALVPQRCADDDHRQQVGARRRRSRPVRRAPRPAATSWPEQVVDRVAGQRQLGKHRDRDPGLATAAG